MITQINETVEFLESKNILNPEIGIVLGTGLGKLVEKIDIEISIDYDEIPNFPESTMEFHHGKLLFGTLEGKKILVMQGRYHLYEGYSLNQVVFPIRVFKKLGVQKLLISNAAGAINLNYEKGSLMLLDDHINLQGGSPLVGTEVKALGNPFVDMSAPYNKEMNEKLKQIAAENDITLHEGVYAAVIGPHLETRAEYRYLKVIGADAVGMSTVPEVIAANHVELPCVAISVLTDSCDPDNLQPINIPEILALAEKAEPKMITLFSQLIKTL